MSNISLGFAGEIKSFPFADRYNVGKTRCTANWETRSSERGQCFCRLSQAGRSAALRRTCRIAYAKLVFLPHEKIALCLQTALSFCRRKKGTGFFRLARKGKTKSSLDSKQVDWKRCQSQYAKHFYWIIIVFFFHLGHFSAGRQPRKRQTASGRFEKTKIP